MIFPHCGFSRYFRTFFITEQKMRKEKKEMRELEKIANKSELFILQYLTLKKISVHAFFHLYLLKLEHKKKYF